MLRILDWRALRIIVSAKYNSHTEPIFKSLGLLKLNDIFYINQLKFYFKMVHKTLPTYFYNFRLQHNSDIHHHLTRSSTNLAVIRVNHSFAKKCIRYNLINLLNRTRVCYSEKIYTHSLNGFSNYIKKDIILSLYGCLL